jgi:hypothetical protein
MRPLDWSEDGPVKERWSRERLILNLTLFLMGASPYILLALIYVLARYGKLERWLPGAQKEPFKLVLVGGAILGAWVLWIMWDASWRNRLRDWARSHGWIK